MGRHKIFDEAFKATRGNAKRFYSSRLGIHPMVQDTLVEELCGVSLPSDTVACVNTGFADPDKKSLEMMAQSAVVNAIQGNSRKRSVPHAIVPIIKMKSDRNAKKVADAIVEVANNYRVSVINYLFSVTDALKGPIDVSCAVIGAGDDSVLEPHLSMMTACDLRSFMHVAGHVSKDRDTGIEHAVFDHLKKNIVCIPGYNIVKPQMHNLAGKPELSAHELLAMSDHALPLGVDAVCVAGVAKVKRYRANEIQALAANISSIFDDQQIMMSRMIYESAGGRYVDFAPGEKSLVLDSFTFGLANTERPNLLGPEAGDYAIAVKLSDSPRASGFGLWNKYLTEMLVEGWHENPMGEAMLHTYFARPTPFAYPAIKPILPRLSGLWIVGAGGLPQMARDLQSRALLLEGDLPVPNQFEQALAHYADEDLEALYEAQLPMGFDCLFTCTGSPKEFDVIAESLRRTRGSIHYLGRVHYANGELHKGVDLKAYNGKQIMLP